MENVKSSETIMLVDDEDIIIDVSTLMLSEMGYNVITAGNGMEAVEIYKEKKDEIALVIIDIVMPDMDGGDLYRELKKMWPDIKALLSSGYGRDEKTEAILSEGCNGFIQKPFNMRNLSQKIRDILDG